jgi:hypothetical protein
VISWYLFIFEFAVAVATCMGTLARQDDDQMSGSQKKFPDAAACFASKAFFLDLLVGEKVHFSLLGAFGQAGTRIEPFELAVATLVTMHLLEDINKPILLSRHAYSRPLF